MWLVYLVLTCGSLFGFSVGFISLSGGLPATPFFVLGIIFSIAIIYIYIKDKADDIKASRISHNLEQQLDALREQYEDALQKSDNVDNQINIDTRKNDDDKEHTSCELLHGVKFYDKRIK